MRKKHLKNLFKGTAFLVLAFLLSSCKELIVLNAKGPIGQKETQLIYAAIGLMLIVVVPVFVMVIWFSIRYRASNKKATYKPNWSHSTTIEYVVWGVPIAIIVVLSYLTWTSTKHLDPYKPIQSDQKPLVVDVISTDWNWVFLYPQDSVASVNELVIETGRPVSFRLTSASVMTSFFIPQLGSQMYAMAGMRTKLNLMSDHSGEYEGHNLEYSGEGYNEMGFNVLSKSKEDFSLWMKQAKASSEIMDMEKFKEISQPQDSLPIATYSLKTLDMFDLVMAPFMDWMNPHEMHMMHHGEHMMHHGDHHMMPPPNDSTKNMTPDDNMQMPPKQGEEMEHNHDMNMHHDMKSMPMDNKKMEDKK